MQFNTAHSAGTASPWTGPLLMTSSAFLFAVMGLAIKLLSEDFRVWDFALFRFGGGVAILLLLFPGRREWLKTPNPLLMALRGLSGTTAFFLGVSALQQISLATAMVYFYCFPAFAALFSALLFKERIAPGELICVAIALCGVGVLFDLDLGQEMRGQMMALLAGVFAGLTVALIKRLRADNGPVGLYFYLCLCGCVAAAGPFSADPHWPVTTVHWGLMGGIVATSTAAQLLMNQGFKYCASWEGGLFMTTEVIFTTLFGAFLLGETLTLRFWTGGMMIIGSSVLMGRIQHNAVQRQRRSTG